MKKLLSIITVFLLVIGISLPMMTTYAKTKEVESGLKIGVVTAYTEKIVTIVENGKKYTLPLAKNAKILKQGEIVNLTDAIFKGAKVQYKTMLKNKVPVSITYIDVPPAGSIYEGLIGTSFSNKQLTTFSYEETPKTTITKNPSLLYDVNSLLLTKELITDYDSYVLQSDKVIFIGNYSLNTDSIILSIDGKEIKIISDKAEFDQKDASDEAKLSRNSRGEYLLTLETPLTKEQMDKADTIIKLTYKVKELNMERTEILNLIVNEDVYCELNGKEVSFAKAMYRGNYAAALTNEKGEIIYINAYYKDLLCTVNYISENKLTVTAIKNGYPSFTENLIINEGCQVLAADGTEISINKIKPGDKIYITNSPDLNYQVISIAKAE